MTNQRVGTLLGTRRAAPNRIPSQDLGQGLGVPAQGSPPRMQGESAEETFGGLEECTSLVM